MIGLKVPPRRISTLYPAVRSFPENPSAFCGPGFCGFRLRGFRVHTSACSLWLGLDGLPSRYSLQNALGILDWRDVAVIILDHLDRGSHLFCEEVNIDAFRQAEGGVGMAEAVGAASAAGGAVEKL